MNLRRWESTGAFWILLLSKGTEAEPLEEAISQRLLLSFGRHCDEVAAASRVLGTVMTSRHRRGRINSPDVKHSEEATIAMETVADFDAYASHIFSFKTVQAEEALDSVVATEEGQPRGSKSGHGSTSAGSHIARCRISHTSLKHVGVSVLSLEDCPAVEPLMVAKAFQNDTCVKSAELDSVIHLETPEHDRAHPVMKPSDSTRVPYWQRLIRLDDALDLGVCRREVVVGVIDSGIAFDHPALQPNIWVNTGEVPNNGVDDDENGYVDDVHGYNFYEGNGDPSDPHGHGTHVAGLIGAVPGYNSPSGVCSETSIAALRFMDDSGSGATSAAIEAVNYAVQMGFKISCNSWSGPNFSPSLRQAIFAANSADHLFVTAAGNQGQRVDIQPEYPGSFDLPNIITVAASDETDQLARFSNYGTGRVHLTAPGVDILSTYPPKTSARLSGTSMAAPFVAAVGLLLLSVKPGSLKDVKDAILNSVDRVPHLQSFVSTGGRLNALKALETYTRRENGPNDSPVTKKPHEASPELASQPPAGPVHRLRHGNQGDDFVKSVHYPELKVPSAVGETESQPWVLGTVMQPPSGVGGKTG